MVFLGSSMDTPTSQGDNRYSYPNTTLESINKIHNAYAIDHNLGLVYLECSFLEFYIHNHLDYYRTYYRIYENHKRRSNTETDKFK